jgi:GrpB-like predicted nucleotidyltransferase (UPF0157 family)
VKPPQESETEPVELVPELSIRDEIKAQFEWESARIKAVLPDADVQHIGATAIPGSVTKGDLDLLVRVAADHFSQARLELADHFQVHQRDVWGREFASYVAEDNQEIAVGVQLVVADSVEDQVFRSFRDALWSDPDLVVAYNRLKEDHADDGQARYRRMKESFIRKALQERGVAC